MILLDYCFYEIHILLQYVHLIKERDGTQACKVTLKSLIYDYALDHWKVDVFIFVIGDYHFFHLCINYNCE